MSLADEQWCPASVQVTVLQARGLRIKGKSGTNDAYAVMQVGKEKYQTSVVEKSVAPVWKEEASFDLPQLQQGGGGGSTLHVHVLHRALVGPDKLLGQAVINLPQLSEDKTRSKTEWFKLLDKTGKPDKDRGEVLLDIQFMRNNMTASMFDLSAAGKSRSRLSKFKDKVRGKKKESDSVTSVVPSFTQVLTDSEEEANGDGETVASKDVKHKKHKIKALFSPKSNLQRNMSQSMSVLPAKNSLMSSSQSSGLNVDSSEGKKKLKFMMHKRSGSSDGKDSSGHEKQVPVEQSNLCINGSHIYCEEPPSRTSRIGSNFSLASSGHGSMEDVPENSPPSVDSQRAVKQYSPWKEEEEEEITETENTKDNIFESKSTRTGKEDEVRKQQKGLESLEEEKGRREEEKGERLAEGNRLQELERRKIEEKKQRDEEERIRIEEEKRLKVERVRMEEKRQEEQKLEEERRLQELERRKTEEEERIRVEEVKRRLEEERKKQEEQKLADEKRIAEEEKRRQEEKKLEEERRIQELERRKIEEEEERIREEEMKRRLEEEQKLAEEKRRLEEEERIRIEEKRRQEEQKLEEVRRIKELERRKIEEEEEMKRRLEEEQKLAEEKRRLEEEERIRIEEKRRQEEQKLEEERRIKELERRKIEEEEEMKRRLEEEQKLAEEKRRLEEEERIRIEKRRQEEQKLAEEERRIQELERRKIEEEERIRVEEMKNRQEEQKLAEEKRRLEEERVKKEKEEKAERERRQKEEEELVRKQEHEKKIQLEQERRQREEEERVREEEERVRKEKEEYEKERKLIEAEEERMRIEEKRIKEHKRRAELEKIRKQEEMRQDEERARKKQEEHETLKEKMRQEEQRRIEEEERFKKEEQERVRMEEEIKRKEEEDRARKEKEIERLERRKLEEQEKRIEEAERIKRKERGERERKEEEARKLEKLRDTEQEKRGKTGDEERFAGKKSKVSSPAVVTSTNPFDENYSFEEIPKSPQSSTTNVAMGQQRFQSAVSPVGSKTVSIDEKDLISTQRDKRPAPKPPGRTQAEKQNQKEQDMSTQHLVQINKQSKDKGIKTVSVPPQRSVQMITPLSRSPTDSKNSQSFMQNDATNGKTNAAKHSKRPAPSIPDPLEENQSFEPKMRSNLGGSEEKQVQIVYGLNPFEDDEDENQLMAEDDKISGNTGSIQWPPAVSQTADTASQAKIKSSKMARAPLPPAKDITTSSISVNTERSHATTNTGVTVPDNIPNHASNSHSDATSPVHVQENTPSVSQPLNVQNIVETGVKKDGAPTPSRRLQPVRPLNPPEQQGASVVQVENENKSSGILSRVQDKTKGNDTGMKGPYSQLTREELISLVLKQENQLSERDKKILELEQYIDNLLVRVMEEKPSILMSMNSMKKAA